MGRKVTCNYCNGNKKVTAWNPDKKTYEQQKCPACDGKGVVDTGTF